MWYVGRVAGEGIADVGVLVMVIAMVLPARRHRERTETIGKFSRLEGFHCIRRFVELELPGSCAQLKAVGCFTVHDRVRHGSRCWNVVGSVGHGVFMEYMKIFKMIRNNHEKLQRMISAFPPSFHVNRKTRNREKCIRLLRKCQGLKQGDFVFLRGRKPSLRTTLEMLVIANEGGI